MHRSHGESMHVIPSAARDPFLSRTGTPKGSLVAPLLGMTDRKKLLGMTDRKMPLGMTDRERSLGMTDRKMVRARRASAIPTAAPPHVIPSAARDPFPSRTETPKGSLVAPLLGMTTRDDRSRKAPRDDGSTEAPRDDGSKDGSSKTCIGDSDGRAPACHPERSEGSLSKPHRDSKGIPRRAAPRDDRSREAPRDDRSRKAPRDDGSIDAPRDDGSTDAPRDDGSKEAPRDDGSKDGSSKTRIGDSDGCAPACHPERSEGSLSKPHRDSKGIPRRARSSSSG